MNEFPDLQRQIDGIFVEIGGTVIVVYKANGIQFVAFKAINPDTGLPAEYKELSKSSDGPRWKGEHCYEIG